MKITVHRVCKNQDETLSIVFVNGQPICCGLEDEPRVVKIAGETRIPAGSYPIEVRDVGGFHERYKDRFSTFHRGMLEIANVPGFKWVLIHCGNTDEDTAGCLLVGDSLSLYPSWRINGSTSAYSRLYRMAIDSALEGNLTIDIIDLDESQRYAPSNGLLSYLLPQGMLTRRD